MLPFFFLLIVLASALCQSVNVTFNPVRAEYMGGKEFRVTYSRLPDGHCGIGSTPDVYVIGRPNGGSAEQDVEVANGEKEGSNWQFSIPPSSMEPGCLGWDSSCDYRISFQFSSDCTVESDTFQVANVQYGGVLSILNFKPSYGPGDEVVFQFYFDHEDNCGIHRGSSAASRLYCPMIVEKDWLSKSDPITNCVKYYESEDVFKWTVPADTPRSSGCGAFTDECEYAFMVETEDKDAGFGDIGEAAICRMFSPSFVLHGVRWDDPRSNNWAGGALDGAADPDSSGLAGLGSFLYLIIGLGATTLCCSCAALGFAVMWLRNRGQSPSSSERQSEKGGIGYNSAYHRSSRQQSRHRSRAGTGRGGGGLPGPRGNAVPMSMMANVNNAAMMSGNNNPYQVYQR